VICSSVGGVLHAERASLARHGAGKLFLAAAQRFGDNDRRVVGRLGDEALDGVLDLQSLAGLETEFGRRLARSLLGYWHLRFECDLAGFQALKKQVQRHDLGQRSGVARRVRIGGVQHSATLGVDHDSGVRRVIA
jgi:hypothetical protein